MRGATSTLAFALTITAALWAASHKGAARFLHLPGNESRTPASRFTRSEKSLELHKQVSTLIPSSARFREINGRGLLTDVWINDKGPYVFAIDTGAGAIIISEQLAREARVDYRTHAVSIGGASNANSFAVQEAVVRRIAIASLSNQISTNSLVIVARGLPPDVDGVLDPTTAYAPLGYVIDMPQHEIRAFDPRVAPLKIDSAPAGGVVVSWLDEDESRRPYVTLSPNGGRALLDTGSGFGLAISEANAPSFGINAGQGENRVDAHDIAGGTIMARRIDPATVYIGSLSLRKVPTDLLSGTDAAAPVLLGREALRPFRLTFDPLNRLIEFAPER